MSISARNKRHASGDSGIEISDETPTEKKSKLQDFSSADREEKFEELLTQVKLMNEDIKSIKESLTNLT